MARIVLGLGTSHSPLLALEPAMWAERGRDDLRRTELHLTDGRVVDYPTLAAETGERYSAVATPQRFAELAGRAQDELDRLAAALERTRPDLLVVVGDDQRELFGPEQSPALAVYTGAEVVMHPRNEVAPGLPEWHRQANLGYAMDTAHRHPGAPGPARSVVEGLIERGVDVTVATEVPDPARAGFGHAYGFVLRRLCRNWAPPMLPVLLNTYYPPNVPRPGRCYDIGRALAESLAELPDDLSVAVVASGGLTHFVVDEDFDRRVLHAISTADSDTLRALPPVALRSGTSEILNWVLVAGACAQLPVTACAYLPVRRTPAGTGVGLGFVIWERP